MTFQTQFPEIQGPNTAGFGTRIKGELAAFKVCLILALLLSWCNLDHTTLKWEYVVFRK